MTAEMKVLVKAKTEKRKEEDGSKQEADVTFPEVKADVVRGPAEPTSGNFSVVSC